MKTNLSLFHVSKGENLKNPKLDLHTQALVDFFFVVPQTTLDPTGSPSAAHSRLFSTSKAARRWL